MLLFFDTETTGLWNKNKPMGDPAQPRIAQIAALMTTDDGEDMMGINLVVRQDFVPEQASNIHGKTTEIVHAVGLDEALAVSVFEAMMEKCHTIIAHNGEYDQQVVQNALFLLDGPTYKNPFEDKNCFCTMRASTPLCKIRSPRGGYKWPKLQEAFVHFFGEEFDGAHDALADVRACRDVYFAMQKLIRDRKAAA